MSTTVDFSTVTNAIESLSVTGVTIQDVDEIPDAVGLENSILVPNPAGFVSDVELTPDEQTAQLLTLKYTLTYRYYYGRIQGGLGGLLSTYSGLITKIAAIYKALASDATLSGSVNHGDIGIVNVGPVSDPAGNGYHGCDFTIRITQFLEV